MKEPRAEGPSSGRGHGSLIRALASIEGVTESESAFNDSPALWVNGRELVLELVAEAAHAHAAAPGTTPEPPATGARLEKMKRFH